MKMNTVAIDDEPLALDIIKDYVSRIDYINLTGSFTSPVEAITFMQNNKTDFLLTDINMPVIKGTQLVASLPHRPLVIFTTAHDSYAVEGFELDVIDYLLKPISFERFLKASNKAFDIFTSFTNKDVLVKAEENFFFVRTETRYEKIYFSDILYIEGMSDYLRICTAGKKIMTLQTFKKIEDILPENKFYRIHKSYIVAVDKIDSLTKKQVKIADLIIPVSETYYEGFFAFLKSRHLI